MSPVSKIPKLLVYVADGQEVNVYGYQTHGLLGQLAVPGAYALCSDKSGNIWVSTSNRNGSEMLEYAPGGTQPVTELFSYTPAGCAVDPTSGDLAVVTSGDSLGKQNLEVYHQAQGLPKTYSYSALRHWNYCAYDNAGNLVIQGSDRDYVIAYAELESGQNALISVNISTTDANNAGIQWDGKYFLVGYRNDNVMHRYSISDGHATEIDQIQLRTGEQNLDEFWLHYHTLVAIVNTLYEYYAIAGFPYPAGSPEENSFPLSHYYPTTITVTAN